MSTDKLFKVSSEWASKALINKDKYKQMYSESINDNERFWNKHGQRIDWIKPYSKIKDIKYSSKEVYIKWYYDGYLNVCANCVDRHAKTDPNKIAIIWEGDDPNVSKKITYKELLENVSKTANVLKTIGVKKGDRVTIYLTMIPELAYVMLACSRIGAIHSIIFGGFSAESIAGRINDCQSEFVVTADEGIRGNKIIPLKKIVDEALTKCKNVKKCLIIKRTGNQINFIKDRDIYYNDLLTSVDSVCDPEKMSSEDPLQIEYGPLHLRITCPQKKDDCQTGSMMTLAYDPGYE